MSAIQEYAKSLEMDELGFLKLFNIQNRERQLIERVSVSRRSGLSIRNQECRPSATNFRRMAVEREIHIEWKKKKKAQTEGPQGLVKRLVGIFPMRFIFK